MINKKLNQYLRNRRRELGIKQKDVAEYLNLSSPQFVSNFERNTCNIPFAMLKKLMHYYEVGPKKIVEILLEDQKIHILRNLDMLEDDEGE